MKPAAIHQDRLDQRLPAEEIPAPVAYRPAPFDIPDHWPKNVRWFTPQQIEAARSHATRFPGQKDQPGRGGCTDRLLKKFIR